MRNFRYFFREGVGNMLSHGFMSFAAIGVTVACLLIMGTFTLVAYNANENLADLQQENAIVAFVDETLDEDQHKNNAEGSDCIRNTFDHLYWFPWLFGLSRKGVLRGG